MSSKEIGKLGEGSKAEGESKKEEGGRGDCRMDNDTKNDGRKVGTAGESGIRPRSRQQGERGKKMERREWAFVGVDVIALWGMSLQGAKGPQSGKGGGWSKDKICFCCRGGWGKNRVRDQPPPLFSHRHKLPQIPLTRSPADCSQSPERQLT